MHLPCKQENAGQSTKKPRGSDHAARFRRGAAAGSFARRFLQAIVSELRPIDMPAAYPSGDVMSAKTRSPVSVP